MRVRGAAARTACQNKLHQIGLAFHNYAGRHGGRLGCLDGNLRPIQGTTNGWHSDPLLFTELRADLGLPPETCVQYEFMAEYICPEDPTLPPGQKLRVYDATHTPTSYPANAFALASRPVLPAGIPDGLSNTIGVAERYATCGKMTQSYSEFEMSANVRRPTFADGGPVFGGKNFADVYPITENRVTRPSRPEATFVAAGRAWRFSSVFKAYNDRDIPEPRPGECDPLLPNTPHAGGMNVLLLDGSVRVTKVGIDPAVFWGLVTPAGGEVLGDW
jgi:prepilin-type processing-associated H-X9-DG protein